DGRAELNRLGRYGSDWRRERPGSRPETGPDQLPVSNRGIRSHHDPSQANRAVLRLPVAPKRATPSAIRCLKEASVPSLRERVNMSAAALRRLPRVRTSEPPQAAREACRASSSGADVDECRWGDGWHS